MEWIEMVAQVALLGVAIWGVIVAHKRITLADRNRLEDQFTTGVNLLDGNAVVRAAGAATMADLARNHPDQYDERVMRVFQPFLEFPPRYGRNHRKEGQVDYTSTDTVTIVSAINSRAERERKNYEVTLMERRPFRVNDAGDVERNPDYDDPGTQRDPTPPPAPPPPAP